MLYEFFQIASADPDEAEKLNRFLRTHRIINVEKHFFTDGPTGYWSFCVSWLEHTSGPDRVKGSSRIDYKEVLSEPQFAVYSALRELRKQLADREGMPIYAVATNEQLAEMVRKEVTSLTALQKIAGVGKAKAERYGESFITMLHDITNTPPASDPPEEKP